MLNNSRRHGASLLLLGTLALAVPLMMVAEQFLGDTFLAATRSTRSETHNKITRSAEPAAVESSPEPAAVEPSPPKVAVIGANGKTGALVVDSLLHGGTKTVAVTRSGKWTPSQDAIMADAKSEVEVIAGDVRDKASLLAALAGVSAVVFAAAFSRGSTLPKEVDNGGLVNVARVVKELGIERLVVVSSAATTRPYAPVGALLNTIGQGVLLEKEAGCCAMKGILDGTSSTYTIVKPGGLKNGPGVGVKEIEFNQGDTFVGNVPRADVAYVCAAAATDSENRGASKTFEMYQATTRNPLLPWYGESKYVVSGKQSCGQMLGELSTDDAVTDVPGFLPFSF